jgi:hypothetical protein
MTGANACERQFGASWLQARIERTIPLEVDMENFIHNENLIIFRRRLALATDNAQRQLLLKLLAEEEAKLPVATR